MFCFRAQCSQIKTFEMPHMRNVRSLVDESFVPSAQWTSVLYCRLSDFTYLHILPGSIEKTLKIEGWEYCLRTKSTFFHFRCFYTKRSSNYSQKNLWRFDDWAKKVDGGALKIFRIVMLDLENPFESLT